MKQMARRMTKGTLMILTLAIFIQSTISPAIAIPQDNDAIVGQVQSLIPMSREMVDNAIAVLSEGWTAMTPAEQKHFNQLFDPGNSGDTDEEFIADVLANYKKIARRLDNSLTLAYRPDSKRCEDQRLYYTNMIKIFVCPYFNIEENTARKARVLIHESAHMALLAVDRPYFHKNTYSTRYAALSPRGSWITEIPLLGLVFRELAHNDTLHHPDAYAWFAVEIALT